MYFTKLHNLAGWVLRQLGEKLGIGLPVEIRECLAQSNLGKVMEEGTRQHCLSHIVHIVNKG